MQHQNKILKDYKKLHCLYENGAIFTAFDTETTCASTTTGRIIEIGAVKFSKDGIISTWSNLFNPEESLTDFIINLTHITNQMLSDKPLINQILPEFTTFIKDTILIAHNAQFDLNFINKECLLAQIPQITNNTIDTLRFSKFCLPSLERHKLDYLADYFKIDKGSSHRALDDALTCMELFKKLILL